MAHFKILREFHALRTIVDTRECLINVGCYLKKILYPNIKENTTKNHSSCGQDVVKGTEFTFFLETSKFFKKGKKEKKTMKTCKKHLEALDIR